MSVFRANGGTNRFLVASEVTSWKAIYRCPQLAPPRPGEHPTLAKGTEENVETKRNSLRQASWMQLYPSDRAGLCQPMVILLRGRGCEEKEGSLYAISVISAASTWHLVTDWVSGILERN